MLLKYFSKKLYIIAASFIVSPKKLHSIPTQSNIWVVFKKNELAVKPNSLNKWWRIRDLNPGPTDYDSAALTTELIRHLKPPTLRTA